MTIVSKWHAKVLDMRMPTDEDAGAFADVVRYLRDQEV